MSLEELCSSIQVTFDGQLGKHSQSLVARMISTKMFGGSSTTSIRSYLKSRWGLKSGHQDSVLLSALKIQPATRFGSESEMKAFLDSAAREYLKDVGVVEHNSNSTVDQGSRGQPIVDPKVLEDLKKSQSTLYRQILKAYASQFPQELNTSNKALNDSRAKINELQEELDLWHDEHGDAYAMGIHPIFRPLMARMYDSSWNWALEDALSMFYDLKNNTIQTSDHRFVSRRILITNRATPILVDALRYLLFSLQKASMDVTFVRDILETLIRDCRAAITRSPVAKKILPSTAPCTKIDADGQISYFEIPRIEPTGRAESVDSASPPQTVFELNNEIAVDHLSVASVDHPVEKAVVHLTTVPKVIIDSGDFIYADETRPRGVQKEVLIQEVFEIASSSSSDCSFLSNKDLSSTGIGWTSEKLPLVHIKRKMKNGWKYSGDWSCDYNDALKAAAVHGLSYQHKCILLTGAGENSIGAKVLEGLLAGGAKVIVTTSSYSRRVVTSYQSLFATYGARGSQLVVVPFNQASQRDVLDLISFIYNPNSGLGWDLDHVIPFAAISENGREVDNLDSKSELAHRLMLTNTLRLLGAIKRAKAEQGSKCRPAQVILPLSANHGTFGNDGLYSESKLALEGMFGKWHSESWSDYLSICGAAIGWTRGTNLMGSSDIVSEGIEKLGVKTFSREEMAFNILALMTTRMIEICQSQPILADLNGRMDSLPNIKSSILQIRTNISDTSDIKAAITRDSIHDFNTIRGETQISSDQSMMIDPRANLKLDFPKLLDYNTEIQPLSDELKGMVDLENVVVITGFAEVGPYGNSRTRWEMEAHGIFSLDGCIEMAWIMGLVKHYDGEINGEPYSGWVESKTSKPISDVDVKRKYEDHILEHSGIRITNTLDTNNPGSSSNQRLHEVIIQEDLDPFDVSEETALDFKREHGDKVEIRRISDSNEFSVYLRKGATLMIPKALEDSPVVVGQVPIGWSPKIYGIDESIINQVDPVTLFALVCTIEALLSAGITDAYEIYQYIHVSELGNCLGSGIGGGSALSKIFKSRFLEKTVQNDILQESFINSTAAWINMLLLSSSGPIRTPVGACATSLESLDTGYELLTRGLAKICLVGGFDDTNEDISHEFGNMRATINVKDDLARGRTPKEMSRPMASSRDGFVEAHGCGIQILTTAELALRMGLPIRGIVALTTTASDKIGRSLPAPGKGLLTTVREAVSKIHPPLLETKYRRQRLELRQRGILEARELELTYLQDEISALERGGQYQPAELSDYIQEKKRNIEIESKMHRKEALNNFGNRFWVNDGRISPLRGALATWGLNIDDLGVASFHGTSTIKGDKNELEVIQNQLSHLGRQKGNTILGVCQKYLTGHPKGAAGAWMINGGLQMLDTGLVPGNRNVDNIDKDLEKFHHIIIPAHSIQTDGVKAVSVTSFGFGQKGAQAICVHSKYLFATLDKDIYEEWRIKVEKRQRKANRYFNEAITTKKMFRAKTRSPYSREEEVEFLLKPEARVPFDR
jgi:fatty acid synthase subunit alpha